MVLLVSFVAINAIAQTFELTKTVVNVENNTILTYFEFEGVQFSISESGKLRYKLPSNVIPEYSNGRIMRIAWNSQKSLNMSYDYLNRIVGIGYHSNASNCILFGYNSNKINSISTWMNSSNSIVFGFDNHNLKLNIISKNNSSMSFVYSNDIFLQTQGRINNYNVEIVNFSEVW